MSNPELPKAPPADAAGADERESFGALLSEYELSHSHRAAEGSSQLSGTVISVSPGVIFLDIGFKTEGVLPLSALAPGETLKPGDKVPVTVKGRNEEGYYELSRLKVAQPTDWASLERAFAENSTIAGVVTGAVKGGLSIDVGVRAFLPASRSGARDAAGLEKLVGQEIRCRIVKLDAAEEDVIVDRRVVLEEETRAAGDRRYSEIQEGDTVQGEVRSLTAYGAFIDLGGVDGLLHIGDIAWSRVNETSDVLTVGQSVEAKVLKVDREKHRISLGLKQLQPDPWDLAAGKYKTGERVRGTVSRVTDFGAFVELEPGIEGLIHLSEMSWTKKARKPGDVVKAGDVVEAVVLSISQQERRISLGLKQALGDPWVEAAQRFPAGAAVEGPVTSLTKFGAFVQAAEGVEGMIHISELSTEKRIHHPQEAVKVGQVVRAQVLEIDPGKRQLRLSMKKLVPATLDEYIAEHKAGDLVTGRLIDVDGGAILVELGEGVQANLRTAETRPEEARETSAGSRDLSSLTSMLQARWKGAAPAAAARGKSEDLRAGQIRTFRIAALDPAAKKIDVEPGW